MTPERADYLSAVYRLGGPGALREAMESGEIIRCPTCDAGPPFIGLCPLCDNSRRLRLGVDVSGARMLFPSSK